jgi:amylosucrase
VQNVYAMRPEVRAEYAAVRARLVGDAAFLTRLERFFTELRDPLVHLYQFAWFQG